MAEPEREIETEALSSSGWGEMPTEPEQPIVWREINHDFIPKCTNSAATHLEMKMWNSNVRVFFSCRETWELFLSNPHEIVAIDCESVKVSHPNTPEESRMPLLVQIASPTMVILQFPSDKEGYREEREGILPGDTVAGEKQDPPAFNPYFIELLRNPEIVKVLFDPTGVKREVFSDLINGVELLESVTSSNLDLTSHSPSKLVDILNLTTGKQFETQSRKVNGWATMQSTKSMKRNKRYLIHTASNAWGILHSYLSLQRIFANSAREPPSIKNESEKELEINHNSNSNNI